MSKKQIANRLNDLFSSLEASPETGLRQAVETTAVPELAGWSWTTDQDGKYIACGEEVNFKLGLEAASFLEKPIWSYQIDPPSVQKFRDLLFAGSFPVEIDLLMRDAYLNWQPVHFCILSGPDAAKKGWQGLVQLIPQSASSALTRQPPGRYATGPLPNLGLSNPSPRPGSPSDAPAAELPALTGISIGADGSVPARSPLTETGRESLKLKQVKVTSGQTDQPATIAVPIRTEEMGDLLLEVIDQGENRKWNEEERQMVVEVATQLSLALENARLFQAAQQELSEREKAEAIILHRNRDLATLNRIGQRLTSLTSRNDIFDTLSQMVGQVLDNHDLIICMFDRDRKMMSFPVFRQAGLQKNEPDRPSANGVAEYLVSSRRPLLITDHIVQHLENLGIDLPDPLPACMIGIPILAGAHQVGALVVQNFTSENSPQFDEVHQELLSTAVAQAATAIENASLFLQMQEALKAIENRERYQSGIARAAANLSELGTQSLGDVLRYLGQAAQANRVYFMMYNEAERAWKLTEDWTSPLVAYQFDRSRIHAIDQKIFMPIIGNLRTDGWVLPLSPGFPEETQDLFKSQKIQSALILSVPGKAAMPNLLIVEQIDHARQWHQDETNILRVAADAIANTYVREDLMVQLRANLDETESLYNATNRLVIASDFQEMLAAIINGAKPAGVNRSVMLLFELDQYNKIAHINVAANWYSGHGTPPLPVNSELPRQIFEHALQSTTQSFFENVSSALLDEPLRQALRAQNITTLAILPMWSGKRQLGALLFEGEQEHTFSTREKRLLPPMVDQLTISVENMRLFEQTQTALAETALLYNISNGIAQAQNPDDMVALVVNHVLPRGADRCSMMIASLDEHDQMTEVEITGFVDITGESNLKGMRLRIDELPIMPILPEEGLVISDLSDSAIDPASMSTLDHCQVKAAAFAPLRTGGHGIGALVATSRTPTEFDPADIRLFRTVANGIAVAVEKQRLLRQAQRRALELQTASEIARDTTSTLTLNVLLARMVQLLIERFRFYHASIFLVDDKAQFAVIRESTGLAGDELKQRGFRLAVGSRSVVGTVTASGNPLVINDVSASDDYYPNPLLPDTRSEIGLPLKLGERVIGALDIQSNAINAFSKDDIYVLGILADQIAIAIENARAYEISQLAIEDMKEVDRVKSQFLANMSHELRTPLNSIIGFSRVILKGIDGPVNDVQSQDLNAIYNSGQHLLSLINDILDLSKIEAGKMELSFTDLNLTDLINSAMSTASGLVKDKSIKLNIKVADDLPLVRADAIRVRQVLINFLSNAAKFTDEGEILIQANPEISADGKPEVMITVTDTGPGIALADQAKLFLPFSQVDDSPTRKTGGTGLGLSICRSLIELHGGRIGLKESQVGKGSTFFFTLPLPVVEVRQLDLVPGDGNIILAVDDDPQVISLYERYLKPQGFQVVAHTDPRSAVETAAKLKPFAITLDVMMPEMDGWQVIKALKNNPATSEIPIVVCSILEEEEKGFNLGAADYLVKPFLSEDLLNALNRLNVEGEMVNILVVDDDPEDSRLVKKMIEQNKRFQAVLAGGGTAAWEQIQQQKPDGVILDLFMPDMNGFELLGKIRNQPELKDIPIIILTGADLTPEQHKELADSGQNLLSKGMLREKELLNSLEVALRQIRQPNRKAA